MSKPRAKSYGLPVEPKEVIFNPTPEQLREFTEQMPNTRITVHNNTNTQTRVDSRSKLSTYVVTDTPELYDSQTITRAEYERVAKIQNDYIRGCAMVVVDGYIGNDPDFRVPARLIIEKSNANVAAMQQHLYYPLADGEGDGFEPRLTIIYTPNVPMPGYPADRLIAVDLDNGVTRVFNSDYFGESKKGGLRMWNQIVYDRG
ncbi:MAG TPA: phosphoenolpyruvate carboxykinase (ATP), partial [Blastocatellia bacterium]|nr:phosphoenolpyruvate carboxykinase (ATP) [Blastocatellia bacterium]